jgi:hypothetical protein
VTAVARKGELQYAFYRGTTYVGKREPAVPAAVPPAAPGQDVQAPNQPMSEALDSNIKMQNSANSLKQLNRLQQRFNPPPEMRKGAPAANFQ